MWKKLGHTGSTQHKLFFFLTDPPPQCLLFLLLTRWFWAICCICAKRSASSISSSKEISSITSHAFSPASAKVKCKVRQRPEKSFSCFREALNSVIRHSVNSYPTLHHISGSFLVHTSGDKGTEKVKILPASGRVISAVLEVLVISLLGYAHWPSVARFLTYLQQTACRPWIACR